MIEILSKLENNTMVNQSGWHEGNTPSQDGAYLVRITAEDGRELGLGGHPPILVAVYNKKENSWVPHGALIPIHDFGENVIAWHELPALTKD
jgi:hypothetical protein